MTQVRIHRVEQQEVERVVAASFLFDKPVTNITAKRFLDAGGHHLLLAYKGEQSVGFVTGVEMTHPDKSKELFLYELEVDAAHRQQGIATQLVSALKELAGELGCRGMWVLAGNEIAEKTYMKTGADIVLDNTMLEWSAVR